jgi:16S rRNA processing protein RimM
MKKDLFPIGRVVKTHGVKGRVKVDYFGKDLHQFSVYHRIFIEDEPGKQKPYEIVETTPRSTGLLLRFKGIEKIEEAKHLIGKEIFAEKEALLPLEEGEYYWMDVLGMRVETQDGKKIGKVKEIFPTKSNDVYVIEGKRGEILLPAIKGVIQRVDLQGGVIKVVRMAGLWEDEDEV